MVVIVAIKGRDLSWINAGSTTNDDRHGTPGVQTLPQSNACHHTIFSSHLCRSSSEFLLKFLHATLHALDLATI